MTAPTVPDELLGCWQRRWIEFADGTRDDTSFVVWLQQPSQMADVRLSAAALTLVGRGGFDELSDAETRVLAGSDSSSGATVCTHVIVGDDGVRRATAEWTTEVGFQPVSAFPETGMLEWNDGGTVLIERAPSGAYAEEWHLLPGSRGPFARHALTDGASLYRAGDAAVLVRDRTRPVAGVMRVDQLGDRSTLIAALDGEFAFARLRAGQFVIEASTLPWRVGMVVSTSAADLGGTG